jgi:ABC-type sugar transport system permease subunit
MGKISNFFYEHEFKAFSRKRTAEARSTKGVLNHKKTAIFIISLLILPILNWLVFWLFINAQSITMAFQDPLKGTFTLGLFKDFWNRLTTPINNELGLATLNTFLYFGSTIIIVLPLSLIIGYFLYKKIPGYKFFRIIFFLPAIISGLALVTSFEQVISPGGPIMTFVDNIGLKDFLMNNLGIEERFFTQGLLGNKETATPTILFYSIMTSFTTNVLLFSGAMSRVPTEVLESAKLEGCSPFRELIEIIFPLIWPTFSTQLIFTMTGIFTASGPILLFDPNNQQNTITISYWIFKSVMGGDFGGGAHNYNIVACAGLCFTLAGFPIIMLARSLTDKISAVEY